MINWIACLKKIPADFTSEGWSGSGNYNDDMYGEIEFQYVGNKSKLTIDFYPAEPICICGNGFGSPKCDCEWEAFCEVEPITKTFTKKKFTELTQQTLFA